MSILFSPAKIKGLELRNRISVPPMITPYAPVDSGYVVAQTVENYRKLAQGGPGLIVVEATCINMHGRLGWRQLGLWEDGQIEGHRQIANAVKGEGAKVIVQIHHAGLVGVVDDPLCPTDYIFTKSDGSKKYGRAMSLQEIKEIQDYFVAAGLRAYKAGYDGIELHGCHQYLICQFLNKKVNTRNDIYGVDRTLFVREIIMRIKAETDPSWIIGIRLGGFEPTLEDGIENALLLEKAGIDFFDISYGFRPVQELKMPESYPFWEIIYAAQRIKEEVSVPVFAANLIRSPKKAEDILSRTKVDMVGIARGFMVNYNWANDALEGIDVGTCIDCPVCWLYTEPHKCAGRLLHEKKKINLA